MARRGRAALLPDRARRPPRPVPGARSAARLRDDAAAHAGISSRRACRRHDGGERSRGRGRCGSRAAHAPGCTGRSAGDSDSHCAAPRQRRAPSSPAPAALVPASIDAASWPRMVEGGGPQRHGAAVRAQLRPGLLRARRAHVAARRGGGRAALARHRGEAPAGIDQISGSRDPAGLRGVAERARDAGASACARGPGQSRARGRCLRGGSRSSRDCRSDSVPRWIPPR